MALTDKLTNIADAIREKTGSTRTMNLEEMAAAVTNIKIPTALSDLNEDETHRTVTDAEKKTWNDKSDFSGNYDDLKNKQLAGTTDELTPTQVYEAVSTGRPVKVQYTDRTYGALFFTAFNVAESLNVIVSQTIVYVNGVYILAELIGNKSDNTWGFNTTTLAVKIPEGGSGEAWELLYETTLTEDAATFSQEIPACSKVKMVIFPGSAVTSWKRIIINGTSYPTMNNSMSAEQAYFVSIDALLPPYITASIGIYTNPAVSGINGGSNYSSYAEIGDSITKIGCGTAGMLVTGAIIKIWGVRK